MTHPIFLELIFVAAARKASRAACFLLAAVAVAAVWARPVAISAREGAPAYSATVGGARVSWKMFVRLGPDGRPATPRSWACGRRGQWLGEIEGNGGRLTVALETSRVGPWVAVAVKVANGGKRRALVEIGWKAEAQFEDAYFWGGWRTPKTGRKYEADRGGKVFPLGAIYDAAACAVVAVEPSQFLSYLRHAADLTKLPATLETATRIVVDPGAADTVTFLMGAYETSWGYLEALHYYYEAFPRWFRALPDVDPRVNLNGGSYLVWREQPLCDLARRLQVGWEWCYAPFRRTGDIYGRPELWDYKPARPMAKWRQMKVGQFHRWRKRRFAAGEKCDVVMAFYIPAQIWCEEQLARQRYADAIVDDPKAKTFFNTPWVTGHDNELRVFPLQTSFGRQSRKDMAAVIEELDLTAFAIDVAGGGARYYGPAVNRCPGRAWDERGVYVDEAVAIAKLIDWIHEQRRRGRRVAAIINPGPYASYMTAFRCDSSMLESTPVSVSNKLAQALRARLGHKTMVLWETYDYEQWLRGDLTREQYVDALRGVADWTVLACMEVVVLPTPRIALGMTPIVRWLPTMRDMVLAGWEPVPAARRPDGQWVSRAGRGLGSFLATGNLEKKTRSIELSVEDEWIGEGKFLWAPVGPNGPALVAEHQFGKGPTHIKVRVGPTQPVVLRSVATFIEVPAGVVAAARWLPDAREPRLTVELRGSGRCAMVLGAPKMAVVSSAVLDGQPLALRPDQRGQRVEFSLRGSARLSVKYRSQVCDITTARLQSFAELEGNAMNFSVVVPPGADPLVERAAKWIASYFRPYYRNAVDPPRLIAPVPIVSGVHEVRTARMICLRVSDNETEGPGWKITAPDTRTIEIRGRTPRAVADAVRWMLGIWDGKFVWAGPLPRLAIFKRVGLAGKQLPPRPAPPMDARTRD